MLTRIRQFFAAPTFEDDENKTRIANLLNVALLTVLAASVVGIAIITVVFPPRRIPNLAFGTVLTLFVLGLRTLMRHGHLRITSILLSFALWAGITFLIFTGPGVRDPSLTGYFLVIAMAGLLLGNRAAAIFGLLSVLGMAGTLYAEVNGLITVELTPVPGMVELVTLTTTLSLMTLMLRSAVRSTNQAFDRARRYATELEDQRELLEQTVEERTLDLAHRARYLEATAEVARDAASVLDLQELLSRTVMLVSEQFGFYHTGIFLLDPAGEWAVLRAASSAGGQRMLARGHRLRVGHEGIVGFATGQGQPRIALDVGEDAVFFDNPDLPETRSEMALPLQARGQIIGALDVQSQEPQAFSDEDVAVLQTLADQVALAISNTRLLQQVQESLETERRSYGEIVRQAWRRIAQTRPDLGYLSNPHGVHTVEGRWLPEMVQAGRAEETVHNGGPTVAVPLKIRDRVAGVIRLRKPGDAGQWTDEEIALVETLTEQLGVALESARLYQDTQRRATRERLTREITDHIRSAITVEDAIQRAIQELGRALGTSEMIARVGTARELLSRQEVEDHE
jgi:GAF domain-containing protein